MKDHSNFSELSAEVLGNFLHSRRLKRSWKRSRMLSYFGAMFRQSSMKEFLNMTALSFYILADFGVAEALKRW